MILQSSILLSTNNATVTIPELSAFKYKNDLYSAIEFNNFYKSYNEYTTWMNERATYHDNEIAKIWDYIKNIKQETIKDIFKVGDVFISFDIKNPSEKFGGTWVLEKDRFLLGAGGSYNVNVTGGEETCTLTIDEIPKHTHNAPYPGNDESTSPSWAGGWGSDGVPVGPNYSYSTDSTGSGYAHNNMPPYIAVYIWKKTA